MTKEDIYSLAPIIRLCSGLSMAAYGELLDKYREDTQITDDQYLAFNNEYDLALDIFCLNFEPAIN